MAVQSRRSIASLMQKTLDRQAASIQKRLRFKENQIKQILKNYVKNGEIGPYNELIKVLRDYPLDDDNYRIVFDDSLSCVVVLGSELQPFVDAVCNIEWTSRNDELVELYTKFVLNLVTAHTYHCPRVISSLVKLFKVNGENWKGSPPSDSVNKWSNIHSIIAQIVAVMPLTTNILVQIVMEQMPYYKAGCYANRAYIHNLIWMSKYLPSLREQIMASIIIRLIEMDTNIVDREKNKSQNETLFEMDMEDEDDMTNSLDYCMLEVLQWLQDERDSVLNVMCNVFEKYILPTHGIRHVQFLVVYTISVSQQCADRILNKLWLVAAGLQRVGGALAPRRAAAAHLAGLLARAVRVPPARTVLHLRAMCDWCHAYVAAAQDTPTDGVNAHGAFHAICHAVFYLVAFKHHFLFSSKENVNFVESLNLPRLVTSSLNPLKTCPPQVIRAFSSVTRAHQVVYCQAILEKNSRHSLMASSIVYDEWFPYDPYTLLESGKIIWPLCAEYKDWSKEGDDEDQFSNIKKKFDAEDDDFLMASPSQILASSLSNCISPGFKTSDNMLSL